MIKTPFRRKKCLIDYFRMSYDSRMVIRMDERIRHALYLEELLNEK